MSLERLPNQISYQQPQYKLISNLTGKLATESIQSADYWVQHIADAVQFSKGIQCALEIGVDTFIEVGPHPTLSAMGLQSTDDQQVCQWISSSKKGADSIKHVFENLRKWYMAGGDINWYNVYANQVINKVELPIYPFQRKRYWVKTKAVAGQIGFESNTKYPLAGSRIESPNQQEIHYILPIDQAIQKYLADHQVFDHVVVPGAFYISVMQATAADFLDTNKFGLQNIEIQRPLILKGKDQLHVTLEAVEAGHKISLYSKKQGDWLVHASAIVTQQVIGNEDQLDIAKIKSQVKSSLNPNDLVKELRETAVNWGPKWQWIKEVHVLEKGKLLAISAPQGMSYEESLIHPALIDGSFLGLWEQNNQSSTDSPNLPFSIERFEVYRTVNGPIWCICKPKNVNNHQADINQADYELFDENGFLVARITGFSSKKASKAIFMQLAKADNLHKHWLYQSIWEPVQLKNQHPIQGDWQIVSDESLPFAQSLQDNLLLAGAKSVRISTVSSTNPSKQVICLWPAQTTENIATVAKKHSNTSTRTTTRIYSKWC